MTHNYDWLSQVRDYQLPPREDWSVWAQIGGRGAGKTRALSEFIRSAAKNPGETIMIVSRSHTYARDILIDGYSGILSVTPPSERPVYTASTGQLVWPNGTKGFVVVANRARELRGPQSSITVADHIENWTVKMLDQAKMATRLGSNPRLALALVSPVTRIGATLIYQSTTPNSRVFVTHP